MDPNHLHFLRHRELCSYQVGRDLRHVVFCDVEREALNGTRKDKFWNKKLKISSYDNLAKTISIIRLYFSLISYAKKMQSISHSVVFGTKLAIIMSFRTREIEM
jgi:hypothetical protein